jgi:hypothetical protein
MLAYATEAKKGAYTATFWSILCVPARDIRADNYDTDGTATPGCSNLGAVLGSAIQLGLNFHSVKNNLGNSTYIAFLVLAACGTFIPLALVRIEIFLAFVSSPKFGARARAGGSPYHASVRWVASAHTR